MIYFASNNPYYKKSIDTRLFSNIKVLTGQEGIDLFFKIFKKKRILSVDIEATGLDPYLCEPLLYGIGTPNVQIMFDWTVDISEIFNYLINKKIVILGHNLKYDIKVIYANYRVLLERLYDTMICEQRLFMRLGYRYSYADLVERYLKKGMIKTVRNEFIGVNKETFKITPAHLEYLKGDLVELFEIRKMQKKYIKAYKLEFLIYGIEFPLIPAIAEAELEGFVLNVEKWKERIKEDEENLFKTQLRLDEIVRELRDGMSIGYEGKEINPKYVLSGAKYNTIRINNPDYNIFNKDGTTNVMGLFGEPLKAYQITGVKRKVSKIGNNIDYNKKKEIVTIFAALQQPLIRSDESFGIPKLNSQGKLINSVNEFTLREDYLNKYLLLKPNTIMKEFIELIIKHSKLEKALSTYGENFISKINPVTGHIHTIFRQCDADTGRFQSGGGKKESDKYNAQNIPADNRYRTCFTVDTTKYSVKTNDYSGAELIVMASHAQDFKLIELSENDMHSHMATASWRNIYGFRAKKLLTLFTKSPHLKTNALIEEYTKNVENYRTFTVTKEFPKGYRTNFKGMTFGTIYGMYAKKAGEVLNIIKEEGQVVINTIKSILPKTFAMVEKASEDAERQGFVILNNRTNSRAWFPLLIKQLRREIDKTSHFKEISEELSAARNIRIQGTQADFVKEATVVLRKRFKLLGKRMKVDHKTIAMMLSWVHDEIVFRVNKTYDGHSEEYNNLIKDNPDFRLPFSFKGKEYLNLSELIDDTMEEVANRYLHNVKIKVETVVTDTWIK